MLGIADSVADQAAAKQHNVHKDW